MTENELMKFIKSSVILQQPELVTENYNNTHQQFPTSVLVAVEDFLKGNPEFLTARVSGSGVVGGAGTGSDTDGGDGGEGAKP